MSTTRIEQRAIFKARFTGRTDGNPYLNVTLSAKFTNGTQARYQVNRDQRARLIAQWVKG